MDFGAAIRTLAWVIPEDLVPSDCPWPIVLGIDPGTRALGYGALVLTSEGPRLVACGVLRAPSRAVVAARLARLQEGLELLLARLRPTSLAVESAFSARNVKSALRIGEARGVVLAAAARAGLSVDEVPPALAKKAVLGHGRGSKEQVASLVATILGREELAVAHDATDALAVALAHVNRLRAGSRIAGRRPRLRPLLLPGSARVRPMIPHLR